MSAATGVPALIAVVAVQAVLLAGWVRMGASSTPRATATICAVAALAADLLATFEPGARLSSLAAVVAVSMIVSVVVQLGRGTARSRVTQSIATTIALTVLLIAYAVPLLMLRAAGTATTLGYAAAVVAGVAVARLIDAAGPWPRLPAVPRRGGLGLVAGVLAGTAAAAAVTTATGPSWTVGAWLGWGAALAAVLVDLGGSYAAADREAGADTVGSRMRWIVLLSPLAGFAAGAPVAYALTTRLFS